MGIIGESGGIGLNSGLADSKRVKVSFHPDFVEQPHRLGGKPGVVVVGEGEDANAPSLDLLQYPDPLPQFLCPVDDGPVPDEGPLFDALAVPQPSDVGKPGRDGVAPLKYVVWSRHPRMVNQGKGYAVVPERREKLLRQPMPVPDFQGPLAALWQRHQERLKDLEEAVQPAEFLFVEVGQLQCEENTIPGSITYSAS